MTGPGPRDLAGLLQLLGNHADAGTVAAALITGPLAAFGAFRGILAHVAGDALLIDGSHGYQPHEIDPYRVMRVADDLPITRAVRECEVVIAEVPRPAPDYSDREHADELWQQMWSRAGHGSLVSAPIVLRGSVIGAYGFLCREDRRWTTQDIAALDAYSAVLGLWLGHPDTPVDRPLPDDEDAPAPELTPRQAEILRQVAAGRSTAAIARQVGVSDSTVKAELRRCMRTLQADTRQDAATRAAALGLV